jgi:hypothetical protein
MLDETLDDDRSPAHRRRPQAVSCSLPQSGSRLGAGYERGRFGRRQKRDTKSQGGTKAQKAAAGRKGGKRSS